MKTCRAFLLSCVLTRAIWSPTKEEINKINDTILFRLDAPTKLYFSVNIVLDREVAVHYSIAFLNFLFFSKPQKSTSQINSKGKFPYNITLELMSTKIVLQYEIATKIFKNDLLEYMILMPVKLEKLS